MTASERLKALDEAALYVTNVQTTDTRAYALAILRDALPELIALVEAAEQIEQGPLFVGSRLPDALAALDAELSVT